MVINILHRHLLAIILTPILLMCGWLIVGSPILFVFIIDNAFEISELFRFMLYAIGIGLTISVYLAFPLTLILEKIFAKSKITIVLIIGFLFLVSALILLKFIFDTQTMLDVYPWSGYLLLISFSIAVYSSLFWLPRLRKFRSEKFVDVNSTQSV
jgi:hypothetical protein